MLPDLLSRRNKIHHLNTETDETLLDLFDKDPGASQKTADSNHCTMPSRNYASLTENSPHNALSVNNNADVEEFAGKDGHSWLHSGEVGAGTKHRAASIETQGKLNDGSLDVCINVEIDRSNRAGLTQGYGLNIPVLT